MLRITMFKLYLAFDLLYFIIVCTIYHPKIGCDVPLSKNEMVCRFADGDKHYRVKEAKWDGEKSKWKAFIVDETNVNPNGKWEFMFNLRPTFEYDWWLHSGSFFVDSNKINQLDGRHGDGRCANAPSVHQGDRLRSMSDDLAANATEIETVVENIVNEGVDTHGLKKHSRFNESGIATDASNS